jgi:hypothetical protein
MHVAPYIDKEKAGELLSRIEGIWPRKRKIIRSELLYLPVYVFTANLRDDKGTVYPEMISVDGIKGEFAFYTEREYLNPAEEQDKRTDLAINEKTAGEIAEKEYRKILHKRNLRNRSQIYLDCLSESKLVCYPYWIGYFRRKKGYDFEVIDGVGGAKQGIKMRPVFIDLILKLSTMADTSTER